MSVFWIWITEENVIFSVHILCIVCARHLHCQWKTSFSAIKRLYRIIQSIGPSKSSKSKKNSYLRDLAFFKLMYLSACWKKMCTFFHNLNYRSYLIFGLLVAYCVFFDLCSCFLGIFLQKERTGCQSFKFC